MSGSLKTDITQNKSMKPSFIKYLSFIENRPDLSDQQKDDLHRLLFSNSFNKNVTLRELGSVLGLDHFKAFDVFKELVHSLDLWSIPDSCTDCGHQLTEVVTHCPECSKVLTNEYSFFVDGQLNIHLQEKFSRTERLESQARNFARAWAQRGVAHYLLLDLKSSQLTQKRNDVVYSKFLDDIRDRLSKVKSQMLRPVISFGEIGDCHKLVFLDLSDASEFLSRFSMVLASEHWTINFPQLFPDEPPKYVGTMYSVVLTEFWQKNPDDIFTFTMNGGIDFNSAALTTMFRFDGRLDLTTKGTEDVNLAVWISQLQLEEMAYEDIELRKVVYDKNGILESDFFGLIQYCNGDIFTPNDLSNFYKGE